MNLSSPTDTERLPTTQKCIHHRSLTWPLKSYLPNRKVVFQPPFFRGYVKLQGCTPPIWPQINQKFLDIAPVSGEKDSTKTIQSCLQAPVTLHPSRNFLREQQQKFFVKKKHQNRGWTKKKLSQQHKKNVWDLQNKGFPKELQQWP